MTAAFEQQVGKLEGRVDAHDTQIDQIRTQQREDRDDVRGLRNWIIATLATVCGGTVAILVTIMAKKTGLT